MSSATSLAAMYMPDRTASASMLLFEGTVWFASWITFNIVSWLLQLTSQDAFLLVDVILLLAIWMMGVRPLAHSIILSYFASGSSNFWILFETLVGRTLQIGLFQIVGSLLGALLLSGTANAVESVLLCFAPLFGLIVLAMKLYRGDALGGYKKHYAWVRAVAQHNCLDAAVSNSRPGFRAPYSLV